MVKGRLRLQSGRFPPVSFAPKGRVSRRLATGEARRGWWLVVSTYARPEMKFHRLLAQVD
ncbi:MAG: hypothetical protein ACHBN1_24495 [Heteroscytonema crispum UTEX LB 1556]